MHTDEEDMAALFLYRKLSKEPIMEPVMIAGPDVGASEETMTVHPLHAITASDRSQPNACAT